MIFAKRDDYGFRPEFSAVNRQIIAEQPIMAYRFSGWARGPSRTVWWSAWSDYLFI